MDEDFARRNLNRYYCGVLERFRVVAACRITIDEFPLRHGILENLRVAWVIGNMLGKPAMILATETADGPAKVSVRFTDTPQ